MRNNRAVRYLLISFIGFALLFVSAFAFGQTPYALPKVIGKLSVLHFLDPLQPSLHFALEHRLKDRWYLHHQAGYLYRAYSEVDIQRQQGFRLRTGIRHYTQSATTRIEKTFLEFSASYMQSLLKLEDDFCRFDCAYMQRIEYERRQNIYTVALDYGVATYFSERFIVEMAVSGGLRFGNSRYSNVPPDAALFGQSGFNPWRYNPEYELTPIHFALRLKLGYVLK